MTIPRSDCGRSGLLLDLYRSPDYIRCVSKPRLYLVCGLPGSGKTTRSRAIASATGAIRLCPDEWLVDIGVSLVDYPFRFLLQGRMLRHAEELLRAGVAVIIEFGSWSRAEREDIRQVAVRAGASTELHFMDAPLEVLRQRVLARGGPDAEVLANKVLMQDGGAFEPPSPEEARGYDRFVGPHDGWPEGESDKRVGPA
ncbi:AAA family ATPase [Sorangium sp. So ce1335]|uniref:AAA family ATPase n=1 Tax=Sorangium sp. So ce1335 TaxID=3133335 RepID=UPI003F633739